ncbi:metal-binding protein [compost metagenome]
MRDAHLFGCDAYITGEKILYTIQYAKFINMNLIVGSHTFTEIFGVKSFAEKIKEKYDTLEIIELVEEHIE